MGAIPYPIRGLLGLGFTQTQLRENKHSSSPWLLLLVRAQAGQHPLAGGGGGPPAAVPAAGGAAATERG